MRATSGEFYRVISGESGIKYWSFFPNKLTSVVSHFKIDEELTHILMWTHRLLGILEGTIRNLSDVEPFLRLGMFCESQKSCAIDGILSGMDGMFRYSAQTENDLAVCNYYILKELKKMPVTTEVLCDISQTLMAGATKKKYGSIRQSIFLMHPKFISGSVEYNPPPLEYIPELLKDLEHFIKNESSINILIKAAVVYYQFETIHLFECGNGRVGRILILLMLMNENVLCCPFLPIASSLLEEKPIINVEQVSKMLGIAYNTVAKNIGILQELGILEQSNNQSRYCQYHYERLLRIFQFL